MVKESKYVDLDGKMNYFHLEGGLRKASVWEIPKE